MRVIAIDGLPLAHCSTAKLVFDMGSNTQAPISEPYVMRDGAKAVFSPREYAQYRAEWRICPLLHPAPVEDQDCRAVIVSSLFKMELKSAELDETGWIGLDAQPVLRRNQDVFTSVDADYGPDEERTWEVLLRRQAEVGPLQAEWARKLIGRAGKHLEDYFRSKSAGALDSAERSARLAAEAGRERDGLLQEANLHRALACMSREPSKVERIHKVLRLRFPNWSLEDFCERVKALGLTIQARMALSPGEPQARPSVPPVEWSFKPSAQVH